MRYVVLSCCSLMMLFIGREALCVSYVSQNEEVQANFRQLIETNACPGCNLAGAVFNRLDLSEANLEGANLANAKFFLADLAGANLKNANLQGAALGGADLANADLQGANLTGAVLEGAYLKGAQLDGTVTIKRQYIEQGGPDAGETVYVDDEASSKNLPFTDKAYVGKTTQVDAAVEQNISASQDDNIKPLEKMTDESADQIKTEVPQENMPEPVPAKTEEQSKKLVMMSDAVVPEEPETDVGVLEESSEVEKPVSIESVSAEMISEETDSDELTAPEKGEQQQADTESMATELQEEIMPETLPQKNDAGPAPELAGETMEPAVEVSDTAKEEADARPDESLTRLTEMGKEAVVAEVTPQVAMSAEKSPDVMEPQASEKKDVKTSEAKQKKESSPVVHEEDMSVKEIHLEASEAEPPVEKEKPGDVPEANELTAEQETEEMSVGRADAAKTKLIEKLLDDNRCVECDLSGADLSGRNLDEADLERADLRNANLMGADLSEANLKGAILQGADLRNADLREADLYKADLSNTDLTGARFEEALVDMVNLTGAVGADLEGARK